MASSRMPRADPVLRRRRGRAARRAGRAGNARHASPGLPGTFALADPDDEGSRRAALADWLASPENMLTWRSIANRLWHYHFGRGIVDTPNDFGRNGARPTHPELLDWLAVELRDQVSRSRRLHRLIVCSAVYRQASRDNPAFDAIDADNRYLWRQNRRRLDAEAIRDSVLAVSGTLDRRMGGPGFELFSSRTTTRRFTITPTPPRSIIRRCAGGQSIGSTSAAFPTRSWKRSTAPTPTSTRRFAARRSPRSRPSHSGTTCSWCGRHRNLPARLEAQPGSLDTRIDGAIHLALGRDSRPEERDLLAKYALDHGLCSLPLTAQHE